MFSNKKLHFMHIPKTGGSSLGPFIDFQFKRQNICPAIFLHNTPSSSWIRPEHNFHYFSADQLNQYTLFKGHLGWMPRIFFPSDEIETITFLRDPIELILSQYGHICRDKEAFPQLSHRWKSFDEFIFDPHLENFLLNQQIQHFCADKSLKNPKLPDSDIAEVVGIWMFAIPMSSEAMLQLALERLHQCVFIGITEHYDEAFKQLCLNYAWLPPKKIPKVNVTEKRIQKSDISPKAFNRIMELNQLDLVLYQEAVKIYENRNRICFEKKVCAHLPVLDEVQFSFDDKIIGDGWHSREGQSNNTFCWNASTRSTLVFSVNTQHDLYVSFLVVHSVIADLPTKLKLLANDFEVKLAYKEHPEKQGIIFEGIIEKNFLRKNSTLLELAFSLSELIQPCTVNPDSLDTRYLGFACEYIEIKPVTKSLEYQKSN